MLNDVNFQDYDLSVVSVDGCSCSLPSSAGYRPGPAAGRRADGSVASSLTISETCGFSTTRPVPTEILMESAPLSTDRQLNRMTRSVVSAPATILCAGSPDGLPETGGTGKTNGTDPISFFPNLFHRLSRHKGLPYLISTLLLVVMALSAALNSSYSEVQRLRAKLDLQNTTSVASSHLPWSELRRLRAEVDVRNGTVAKLSGALSSTTSRVNYLSAELYASESKMLGLSVKLSMMNMEMDRLKSKADLCTPFAAVYERAREGVGSAAETTASVVHYTARSLYTRLHTALGGSYQQDMDKKKVYGAMVILSFISVFISSGLSGLSESSE
eukprot:CAMPEP_0194272658 /NCGR_PEP_ID=MMETSP0169-20130528/6164_1 /TAXON_ID=218684 /ORGANISM="Corethron pennatum, Strain L29A3" /LENGTH=328 /DNA_ID=CAMNT_0039015371 /DNA_START=38 /DNA_END=1024 /DNA_ORIENTATION=+